MTDQTTLIVRTGNNDGSSSIKDPIGNPLGGGVPSGFVLKLYQMVNGAPDEVISWLPSGDAFRISDLLRLENETLPTFFRHKRFQSLVRQLNFYNFRKVNRERTFWVYRHQLFHRDKPGELYLLRRRTCPGVDGRKHRPDLDINSLESGIHSPKKIPLPENTRDEFSDESQGNSNGTSMPKRQAHLSNIPRQPREKKFKRDSNNTDTSRKHRITSDTTFSTNIVKETPRKANGFSVYVGDDAKSSSSDAPLEASPPLVTGCEEQTVHSEWTSASDTVFPCVNDNPNSTSDIVLINRVTSKVNKITHENLLEGDDKDIKGPEKDTPNPTKKSRSERMEQSLLVSKVARQLEAYTKRAAAVAALNYPRKGKRITGTVTPPSDTMKYHALTYDDEGEIYESVQDCEVISISSKKICGETVVTDDDSEDSSSTHSKDDSATTGIKEISSEKINKLSKAYSIPPVEDTNLISEVVRKLHNWVGSHGFFSRDDGQLAAAIAGFCMSTAPQDPSLGEKALKLMVACSTLAQEFRRYKTALLPNSNFSEMSSPSDTLKEPLHIEQIFQGERDGKDAIRNFKVFLLNSLDDLVRDSDLEKNVLLTRSETNTLHDCVRVWFAGVKASA